MTTWRPISGSVPQYQKSDGTLASGYYLKFYEAGTTTPLSMATDSTGGTTLAKCQINSSGYPITAGSAVFVPHLSQDYKIVLYKNSTDADADTTVNADWEVDNVPVYEVGSDEVWGTFAGAPTQTSAITFTLTGDQTSTFSVGTKLKLTDASTIYGIVTAVAFSSVTTVTVLATADLSGSLSAVEYAKTYDDGQTKGLVLDARTYVVTSSRTITNDFVIPKGCLLNISSSQTLTISGSVEAGLYQIFSGSGVVRGFDSVEIFPQWWGAVNVTGTDNEAAIEAMFRFMEAKTTGGNCTFPGGVYDVVNNVTFTGSNWRITGYGATIKNTNVGTGYLADGLVIGNKDVADGEDGTNTSPFVYSTNNHIKGFVFEGCRIGLYMIYCQSCSVEDIESDGVACIAIGNDTNLSPCKDMHIKNIRQTAFNLGASGIAFYIVGVYSSSDFVIDGVYSVDAGMAGGASASAKQITISASQRGIIKNFHVDQVNKLSGGIEVIDATSSNITFMDGTVRRCLLGCTLFAGTNHKLVNVDFIDNFDSINVTADSCTIDGNTVYSADNDAIYVATDANNNTFKNNDIRAGAITEQIAGRLAAQAWLNNIGGYMGNSTSVLSYASNAPIVVANMAGSAANVTSDGTRYTIAGWTEAADFYSQFDPTTGIFTCVDVGGWFRFDVTILTTDVTAATGDGMTLLQLEADYNNGTRTVIDYTQEFSANTKLLRGSFSVGMNRNDTMRFNLLGSGGASALLDVASGVGRLEVFQVQR